MKKILHKNLVLDGNVVDSIFCDVKEILHNRFKNNRLSVIWFTVGSDPANFKLKKPHEILFNAEVGLFDPTKQQVRDPNTILERDEIRRHVSKDEILELIVPKFNLELSIAAKAKGVTILSSDFETSAKFTNNGEVIKIIFYCEFSGKNVNNSLSKGKTCQAS